jgi:hypothetical protein
LSERDYARKVVLQSKASKDTPVQDITTRNVVGVGPAPDSQYGAGKNDDAESEWFQLLKTSLRVAYVSSERLACSKRSRPTTLQRRDQACARASPLIASLQPRTRSVSGELAHELCNRLGGAGFPHVRGLPRNSGHCMNLT